MLLLTTYIQTQLAYGVCTTERRTQPIHPLLLFSADHSCFHLMHPCKNDYLEDPTDELRMYWHANLCLLFLSPSFNTQYKSNIRSPRSSQCCKSVVRSNSFKDYMTRGRGKVFHPTPNLRSKAMSHSSKLTSLTKTLYAQVVSRSPSQLLGDSLLRTKAL